MLGLIGLRAPREGVVPAVLYAGQFLVAVRLGRGHLTDGASLVALGHIGSFGFLVGVSLALFGPLAEVYAGSLGLKHRVAAQLVCFVEFRVWTSACRSFLN